MNDMLSPQAIATIALLPFTFVVDADASKAMTAVDARKFLVRVRPSEEKS